MIARFTDREDGRHLRGVTGTGFQRANSTFEIRDPVFKNIRGWVGDARVDVAGFLQGEQARGAVRALQVVCGGLVDGYGAAPGAFLGCVSRVKLAGIETKF